MKNTFTPTEQIQVSEIKRRVKEFKNGNVNATCIFLGFPSEVKTLKEKNILIPAYRETKRVLNWYNLTENGRKLIFNL